MALKSFDIQGFKTFPDKISLPLQSGITAVVGPNGSGKSNIADAFRWVLGEQNPRVLRCEKKMEEIIFHGTEHRGAVGFSEVTLLLDNSKQIFPVEQDEFTITRRLYRSGESEYYLNKIPTRLKDITEILLDTGLGTEGYSIIGQGLVKKIISDKSGDRRKVFEEASGISKYRHRKEESERKLRGADENLLRIGDKISELEPQVNSLKNQAETAKKYLLLRDELRGHEINLWIDALKTVRHGFEKLRDDFKIVSQQAENGKNSVENLYSTSSELEQVYGNMNIGAENARNNVNQKESDIKEIEASIAVLQAQLSHNQENVDRILSELEHDKAKSGGIDDQIDIAKQEKDKLDSLLEQVNQDNELLRTKISEFTNENGEIAFSINQARQNESEQIILTTQYNAEVSSFQTQLDTLNTQFASLEKEKTDIVENANNVQKSLEDTKNGLECAKNTVLDLENAINGYQLRKDNRQKKHDLALQQKSEVELELHKIDARYQVLYEQEKEHQGFSESVRLIMQQKLKNVYGTVADVISVENEYTIAIEIALGSAVQNIIVQNEDDAKNAIGILKARKAGRATFLPISAIHSRIITDNIDFTGVIDIASNLVKTEHQYSEILKSLLGRTIVVDNIDNAILIARKSNYRYRLVTLDGQILNAGGSMTGGSIGKKTGLLSRKNEIDQLNCSKKELEEKLETHKTVCNEAVRELTSAAYDLEVVQDEQREAREQVAVLTSDFEHKTNFFKSINDKISDVELELQTVSQAVDAGKCAIKELNVKVQVSIQDLQHYREKLDKLCENQSSLAKNNEEFALKMDELREKRLSIQSGIAAEERSLRDLQQLKKTLSGDSVYRESSLNEFKIQHENIKLSIRESNDKLAQQHIILQELKQKVQDVYARQQVIEEQRVQNTRHIKEQNETNSGLERECARMERIIVTSEAEEKSIVDKLWEFYQLTTSVAESMVTPFESVSKLNRRISELKKDIQLLGNPNIGAIDAYKEVSERYELLTTQRDDAFHSKLELENIIISITDEMKRIFLEQYTIINEHFQNTFCEIFGGGIAQLEMDNPEDVLNCGIEIKAQPPGKKLRSISLLSGGETSLTAIALYFSLFMVRPAPFCILDEIDHDLDDANVERFATYLAKFSQKTQFIVITHRRGTMECADMLYGVTAQEPGVSKIISLKLSEMDGLLNSKN